MLAAWFNDSFGPMEVLAMDDTDRRLLIACAQARQRRVRREERASRG